MHEDILRIRERLASLKTAMEQFTAGNRDQLFESRDLLRDLTDRVGTSAWSYSSPVCEVVQRLLGNVLRHGGLTEQDSIEVAAELLAFVNGLLDMPAPSIANPQIVHGTNPSSIAASFHSQEPEFEPKGEPIKVSLGMVDESRLGEILARQGLLTQDQLHQALALQQVCRKRLGEVLVSMQLISEPTLQAALDEQRRLTLQMATDMAAKNGGLELNVSAEDQAYHAGPGH